jgi:hypothetical protein
MKKYRPTVIKTGNGGGGAMAQVNSGKFLTKKPKRPL